MPRRPRLLSPAILIRRAALTKGVFGPSRLWKAIAVVVFGRRLLARVIGRQEEPLAVDRLAPGESLTVRTVRPPTRRERRRSRATSGS